MDIYKIGVTIALTNEMSKVIAVIATDLLGLTKRIGEVESAWKKLGSANVMTTLGIGAGVVAMAEMVEHAKDLSHELVQMQKTGMSPELFANLREQAKMIPLRVPGVTQEDVIRAATGTYSVFGEEIGKGDFLERMVKFEQVVANTMGKFTLSTDELVKALRGAEMSGYITNKDTGVVDPDKMREFLTLTERMTMMTHGIVSPSTILGLAQQGGPALMQLDDKGMMTLLMLSQMMGGGRAGTAMMSLYQQLGGGVMYGRTAEELEKLGLLKPEEWKFEHGKVTVTPEASKRLTAEMGKDPMEWAKNVVLPAMAAHGIKGPEEINIELFKMLQRQTTERMVADVIRNMKQMEAEKGRIGQAYDVEKGLAAEVADIPQAEANIGAALHNLNLALVGDGANLAKGLNQLADLINKISGGFMAFDKWTIESGKNIQAFGKALVDGVGDAVKTAVAAIPGIFASLGSAIVDALKKAIGVIKEHPEVTSPTAPGFGGTSYTPPASTTAPIQNINFRPGPTTTAPPSSTGPTTTAPTETPTPDSVPIKKATYDAVPPSGSGTGGSRMAAGDVYLDGRKISEVVAGHLAQMAGGPTEGPPYIDNTYSAPPADSVHAFG